LALRRQQPYLFRRRFYLIYLDNPILTAHGNQGQDHDGEKCHGECQSDFRHCISSVAAHHGAVISTHVIIDVAGSMAPPGPVFAPAPHISNNY